MDPITRASKQFLREAAAHWKAAKGHVLFLAAAPRFRGDLVKTLRLAEASPFCRRPLFLFEEPFAEQEPFFAKLETSLVADYEALREGAAAEGVALAPIDERPAAGQAPSLPRAGARVREIAAALSGNLDGVDLALVPRQVVSLERFADAVAAAAGQLSSKDGSVRLLVWAPPGDALSAMAEGRTARFDVDERALAGHLKDMGPESEGKTLRGLLLSAAEATGRGDHAQAVRLFGEARAWCGARELVVEEAAVLVALAGSLLAAGRTEDAARAYRSAADLARGKDAFPLAAQAALGEGAVRLRERRYPEAIQAYRAASAAAEEGNIPLLTVEALRLEGTAALLSGNKDAAQAAWKKAVDQGSGMETAVRDASTWDDVVKALASLLRKNGMEPQAHHVEAQAAALRSGAAPQPEPHAPPGPASPPADAPAPAAPVELPAATSPAPLPSQDADPPKRKPWDTGVLDLSRMSLPVLPFEREPKKR